MCARRGAGFRSQSRPMLPKAQSSLSSATYHHSTSFLSRVTPLNIALVILNVECGDSKGTRFEHLWQQSSVKLCADGAANRLHDRLEEPQRSSMLPDIITGDLDSLRGDVSSFYAARGVVITGVSEQESNDFEKCLRWLQREQDSAVAAAAEQERGAPYPVSAEASATTPYRDVGSRGGGVAERAAGLPLYSVVAYGAFGGRLDQQMANLNMAYTFDCFRHLFLLSDHSVAFLLRPGAHVIEPDLDAEDGSCGLIPLGGRCEGVVTTGCALGACTCALIAWRAGA